MKTVKLQLNINKEEFKKKLGINEISDTPIEIKDKLITLGDWIEQSSVKGLEPTLSDIRRIATSFPVTTSFFNGLRAKNLNIVGAIAKLNGDTVTLTITATSGVQSVVAGTGISVDNTDPQNPIVTATGSSSGYQSPTGTVNGINNVFVFLTAPNALVVDGVSIRKVASDGTINWSGTTTVTLLVSPNFDVYAVA